MTQEQSLEAITHLSGVIGWLQHYQNRRALPSEERTVDEMLAGLVAIREHIRRDYEAQQRVSNELFDLSNW